MKLMQQKPVINWAYWSRNIYINRYDKDYFVITTNVDHCFQRAGIHSA